jgi:hypothetical protein
MELRRNCNDKIPSWEGQGVGKNNGKTKFN